MLGRALARTARHCLVLVPLLAGLTFPQAALADDPVKGEATFSASGGYARLMKADMTLVDDDYLGVTASGAFPALNGEYINGRNSYDVTLATFDPGSGIKSAWIDRTGSGPVISWAARKCLIEAGVSPRGSAEIATTWALLAAGPSFASALWIKLRLPYRLRFVFGFRKDYQLRDAAGNLRLTWKIATSANAAGRSSGSGMRDELAGW